MEKLIFSARALSLTTVYSKLTSKITGSLSNRSNQLSIQYRCVVPTNLGYLKYHLITNVVNQLGKPSCDLVIVITKSKLVTLAITIITIASVAYKKIDTRKPNVVCKVTFEVVTSKK